jgi:cytosine/adenosine deaminase-related metal-dependent hydrolase
LYKRDNADPTLLLGMATINGATALGVDASLVVLQPGETAGILSFANCHSLESILQAEVLPEWVCV